MLQKIHKHRIQMIKDYPNKDQINENTKRDLVDKIIY